MEPYTKLKIKKDKYQVFGVDKRIRQQHLPYYITPYYVLLH